MLTVQQAHTCSRLICRHAAPLMHALWDAIAHSTSDTSVRQYFVDRKSGRVDDSQPKLFRQIALLCTLSLGSSSSPRNARGSQKADDPLDAVHMLMGPTEVVKEPRYGEGSGALATRILSLKSAKIPPQNVEYLLHIAVHIN